MRFAQTAAIGGFADYSHLGYFVMFICLAFAQQIGGNPLQGFPHHPFPCARRLRRLAGETPGEGLPAKKLSTGQFFLPVLRFASHYPEYACSASSGEISRSAERDEGLRAPRLRNPFEKGLTENFPNKTPPPKREREKFLVKITRRCIPPSRRLSRPRRP